MPVISTNVAANTALRYVNLNTDKQNQLLGQLSSGSRIQRASDDAASLAIGTKLSSDSTTLSQAAISAANAQAVLNTADGGLSQISDILQRMKALTTQAQSGAVDDASRANMDKEFQALVEEIDSIASQTRFNGQNLLDGTSDYATGVSYLLGTDATDTITVTLTDASTTGLAITGDITSSANAGTAAALIDTAINTVAGMRAQVGADISRFQFRANVIDVSNENLMAATSSLMDADLAAVQTEYSNTEVLTEAGIAALTKANAIPQQLLQLLQS
jgi:flagellin